MVTSTRNRRWVAYVQIGAPLLSMLVLVSCSDEPCGTALCGTAAPENNTLGVDGGGSGGATESNGTEDAASGGDSGTGTPGPSSQSSDSALDSEDSATKPDSDPLDAEGPASIAIGNEDAGAAESGVATDNSAGAEGQGMLAEATASDQGVPDSLDGGIADAVASEPDAGADTTDVPAEPMCDSEVDGLNDCDVCVRAGCCGELLACAASEACSGMLTDEGFAAGEFGCVQDAIDFRFEEDGFVDSVSVTEAKQDCGSSSQPISQETEALVDCIAPPTVGPGDVSCASSCFGIVD